MFYQKIIDIVFHCLTAFQEAIPQTIQQLMDCENIIVTQSLTEHLLRALSLVEFTLQAVPFHLNRKYGYTAVF